MALLLHGLGDVVIKLFGVVESMPLFLMGHVLYCRSFARGCDVSRARLSRMGLAKKIVMALSVVYAALAWVLLFPAFESPLRPVLACYIVALVGMFIVSRGFFGFWGILLTKVF